MTGEQKHRGSLAFLGSTAGQRDISVYAASKRSLVGLMQSMAGALGEYRIRGNGLCPKSVTTDRIRNQSMYRRFASHVSGRNATGDDAAEAFRDFHRLPVPWVGPVDVRNAALFRTSDDAGYITGAELTVDLGATL